MKEEERAFVLAALLWLAGLDLRLGIGMYALRIYYVVFGASDVIRVIILLPKPTQDQNGHSNLSTL